MPQMRAVELRVHGVSGGQAEELLDVEPAVRVRGDSLAGFFRWRRKADTETVPGVTREIFAWGRLTSGRSSRALWLLLLPFMLVNLAYWMRAGRSFEAPSRLTSLAENTFGAAARLLALSLTALLVLAAAGVGMDLVGWQCAGYGRECAQLRPLLGMLSAPQAPLAEPARALAAGALLPLLVTALLWWLSRRSRAHTVAGALPPPVQRPQAPLSDPDFWQSSATTERLRSAHVAVAVSLVAFLLAAPALHHDQSSVGGLVGGLPVVGLPALTAALSAVGTVLPDHAPWRRRADTACRLLRNASLVLLGAALAYALWPRPGWSAEGPLPLYSTVLNTVFALQCVLAAVLFAAAFALYRRTGARKRVPLAGMAGPVAAVLGTVLGGALSAAVVYQAAGWLGGCYYPGAEADGCIVLRPAAAYSWLQLAFTLEAAIALLCAGGVLVALRRRARGQARLVARLYGRPADAGRTRDIARARALGAITEYLPACLVALLLPAPALMGLVLYSALTGQLTPVPGDGGVGGPADATGGWPQAALSLLVAVGAFLGGGFLVALMALGGSAYRNEPTRQAVGMLWDVGTFWPRLAHPLAPPCYGERAVPQLVARVTDLADNGTGVVLSGHSQGSVLAAATLWQIPARCRDRVVLLTHGSPLSRLYARYFPAYFGPVALGDVSSRVAHWRNLWRATDPIGGPVRAAREDGAVRRVGYAEPLPDPRHYEVRPGEALYPPILGHIYYTRDPMYAESLRHAATLLTGQAPPTPADETAEEESSPAVPAARTGDGAAAEQASQDATGAAAERLESRRPSGSAHEQGPP